MKKGNEREKQTIREGQQEGIKRVEEVRDEIDGRGEGNERKDTGLINSITPVDT